MDNNNPANLRARINHYRQMLRQVDDPPLREALEVLIRLTQERLTTFAKSAPSAHTSVEATEGAHQLPTTLGDVLYARRAGFGVLEQDWAALVQSIASGDQVALHALHQRAHPIVLTFVERILGDREAAEEVTIEVFHALWRRAFLYDPARGTVLAWIMNQARSTAMDYKRFPPTHRLIAWPRDNPAASFEVRLAYRISEETGKEPLSPPAQPWSEPEWEQVASGIECKLLATDTARDRVSMLVRLASGASYPAHTHAGTEELFLLDGELWIDGRKLIPGDYNHGAPGTGDGRIWSETGCSCVLVTSINDRLR